MLEHGKSDALSASESAALETIEFGWREIPCGRTAHLPKLAGSTGIVMFDPESRLTLAGLTADVQYDPFVLLRMVSHLRQTLGDDACARCRVFLVGNAAVSKEMLDAAAEAGDSEAAVMSALAEAFFDEDEPDADINDVLEQRQELLESLEMDGFLPEHIQCRWAQPNESLTAYFDPSLGELAVVPQNDFDLPGTDSNPGKPS